MKLAVAYLPSLRPSASPYRLFDEHGQEVAWANAFLDGKRLLRRSPRSLRAYAYDLLHFARWAQGAPPASLPRPLAELTESALEDYLRHQLDQQPSPAPQTVNRRLDVVRALYRFHFGCDIPGLSRFSHAYITRSPLGYGRRRRMLAQGLRLPQPRHVIQPLSAQDVAQFWKSFRTFRDLALVGLMLKDGLRSCEVLALQLADLNRTDAQLRVLGKGNKERSLPLTQDILDVLDKYLCLERPLTNSPSLFVALKGPSRGLPLTAAGLRSLFRHHRAGSQISQANPHRFRHTFGADMVRGGISLPALQQLMGHAQIRTTMLYVQIAPQDVWREYHRAIERRSPGEAAKS
jgi:site-specific recombinase XerD